MWQRWIFGAQSRLDRRGRSDPPDAGRRLHEPGGFSGEALHSADSRITDEYKAYILPAKAMALTPYHLLKDGGREAHAALEQFPHHLSKREYMDYMDGYYKEQPQEAGE